MTYDNSPASAIGQPFASPDRAWFDLQQTHTASYAMGFHTPVKVFPITGNTTVKLDLTSFLQTNPTATPVFDSAKATFRVFFYPQRLCTRGLYGNNILGVNKIEDVAFPGFDILADDRILPSDDNELSIIPAGSLLNRLGFPASILGPYIAPLNIKHLTNDIRYISFDDPDTLNNFSQQSYHFNASLICGYFDICAHYLANPYDKDIPFTNDTLSVNDGVFRRGHVPNVFYNLDDIIATQLGIKGIMQDGVIPYPDVNDYFYAQNTNRDIAYGGIPLTEQISWLGDNRNVHYIDIANEFGSYSSQRGLFPSTYREDYQSCYFDSEEIENLQAISIGEDVESMRLGKSMFNRMFRSILRGKKLTDWIDIQFGNKLSLSDHPIFVGSDSFLITFNDVLNANAQGEIPLGAGAGRGAGGSDRPQDPREKTIVFNTQEPGYLYILLDIVPNVCYDNVLPRMFDFRTMSSFPLPAYAGKTFQDLKTSDICFTGSSADNEVVGKQPLYADFMLPYNTTGGIFNTPLLDTYVFKRTNNLEDLCVAGAGGTPEVTPLIGSTYLQRLQFDYAFPDWGQNGGENYFIKTDINLRLYQPIDKQVLKTRM